MSNSQEINLLITHLTRMSYPNICIAGINTDLINGLLSNKCYKKSNSLETRPLLVNDDWNLDNSKDFKLYKMFKFIGYFSTNDNSKEDFIVTSFSEVNNNFHKLEFWGEKIKEIISKHKDHTDCLGNYGFNELIVSTLGIGNKSTNASEMELGPTLGIYETTILKNFYHNPTGKQWRAEWTFRVWGEEEDYSLDLPITDIKFYDKKNNFLPKELDKVDLPFNSKMEILNSYVSVGFSREYREQRWLQINSIHCPNDKKQYSENYLCPLCNSKVNDFRESNTSPGHPNFRCSNIVCDQGNGWPWSSWDEYFPESDIDENKAPF